MYIDSPSIKNTQIILFCSLNFDSNLNVPGYYYIFTNNRIINTTNVYFLNINELLKSNVGISNGFLFICT